MAGTRVLCLFILAMLPLPGAAVADETICGRLVQGVECVLFESDSAVPSGGLYLLSDTGGFHVGDAVCVTGTAQPLCGTICMQGNGCFDVTKIEAAPAPTQTPTATETPGDLACAGAECSGTCTVCPPCTPGSPCPLAPCLLGKCEVVAAGCTCVTSTVVSPTPTPSPASTPPSTCIGDCNGDGMVTVDELVRGVNIALGGLPFNACSAFDCSTDCGPGPARPTPSVTVACLIRGVENTLKGCPLLPCSTDGDCDDANGCTMDRCVDGSCVHDCLCV
jgi:hypothetical protein